MGVLCNIIVIWWGVCNMGDLLTRFGMELDKESEKEGFAQSPSWHSGLYDAYSILEDILEQDKGSPEWCHQTVLEYMRRRGLIKHEND